jgi:hypothetical protein
VATSITITKTGPLLDANVSATLKRGIRAGIFDVASEVVGTVQEQLYGGHGWVTGRLRGSIGARQFSDLGYEVRSGAITGEPLVYAYWVETGKRRGLQTRFRGYQMFQRAAAKWNSNRSRIAEIMLTSIRKALT